MILWLRKNVLIQLAQDLRNIVLLQQSMPEREGNKVEFGVLADKFQLIHLDPDGVEWVPLSDPAITEESIQPLINVGASMGLQMGRDAFLSSGIPEGFYVVEDA